MQSNKSVIASVIVPVHNCLKTIKLCLRSLLRDKNIRFEIIVIDDASDDGTWEYLSGLSDERLRIFQNHHPIGAAACRNQGIRMAQGSLIFFLDGDCIPHSDWLRSGIAAFQNPEVVAVEGAVYYGKCAPTLRDKVPINPLYNLEHLPPLNIPSQDYAAGNMAYRKTVLQVVGGFDDRCFARGREDTDLAMRVKRYGKILFCPAFKVVHAAQEWDFKSLMSNARRYAYDVKFFHRHGEFNHRWGRVLHPKLLAMLLVPPFFLFWARKHVRSRTDLWFLYPVYCYLAAARFHIWKSAWHNRVLVF